MLNDANAGNVFDGGADCAEHQQSAVSSSAHGQVLERHESRLPNDARGGAAAPALQATWAKSGGVSSNLFQARAVAFASPAIRTLAP